MSATALYRALVDAGANEDLAKEAVESMVYAPEAATRTDIADVRADTAEFKAEIRTDIAEFKTEVKTDLADIRTDIAEFKVEVKTDIAGLRVDMERGFRGMTWRFVGLLVASQALLFTALRITGTA